MADLIGLFLHYLGRPVDRRGFPVFLGSLWLLSVKFLDSIVDQLFVLFQIQFFVV